MSRADPYIYKVWFIPEALKSGVDVTADPDLVKQGPNAACIRIDARGGKAYENMVRLPHGSQASPLTREEHITHYNKWLSYANKPMLQENAERILSIVDNLEELPDVCVLIPLLLSHDLG